MFNFLWRVADCFKKDENGTITGNPTDETVEFNTCYKKTKHCFDKHQHSLPPNETCKDCSGVYQELTKVYLDIQNGAGDQICMDIVDTVG